MQLDLPMSNLTYAEVFAKMNVGKLVWNGRLKEITGKYEVIGKVVGYSKNYNFVLIQPILGIKGYAIQDYRRVSRQGIIEGFVWLVNKMPRWYATINPGILRVCEG